MIYLPPHHGGLAQLARALAWHARGHRFDSDILHNFSAKSAEFRIESADFLFLHTILHTALKYSVSIMRL